MSLSQNYYLKKAFKFENLARHAKTSSLKANCEGLARAYREVAVIASTNEVQPKPWRRSLPRRFVMTLMRHN
jgi:hypothetical protein